MVEGNLQHAAQGLIRRYGIQLQIKPSLPSLFQRANDLISGNSNFVASPLLIHIRPVDPCCRHPVPVQERHLKTPTLRHVGRWMIVGIRPVRHRLTFLVLGPPFGTEYPYTPGRQDLIRIIADDRRVRAPGVRLETTTWSAETDGVFAFGLRALDPDPEVKRTVRFPEPCQGVRFNFRLLIRRGAASQDYKTGEPRGLRAKVSYQHIPQPADANARIPSRTVQWARSIERRSRALGILEMRAASCL